MNALLTTNTDNRLVLLLHVSLKNRTYIKRQSMKCVACACLFVAECIHTEIVKANNNEIAWHQTHSVAYTHAGVIKSR